MVLDTGQARLTEQENPEGATDTIPARLTEQNQENPEGAKDTEPARPTGQSQENPDAARDPGPAGVGIVSENQISGEIGFNCDTCGSNFLQKRNLIFHLRKGYCPGRKVRPHVERKIGFGVCTEITTHKTHIGDAASYLAKIKDKVINKMKLRIDRKPFRCKLNIKVEFTRTVNDETEFIDSWFCSKLVNILNKKDIRKFYKPAVAKILNTIETFIEKGSGWGEFSVLKYKLQLMDYDPLGGGSYIPTPPQLKKCKALTNIRNFKDDLCFPYCVSASQNKMTKNKCRVGHYEKLIDKYNIGNLSFPLRISKIPKFEKLNNLKFNVFTTRFQNNKIKVNVIYQSANNDNSPFINLLLLSDENTNKNHFVLINDLSLFVRFCNKNYHSTQICERCLHTFWSRNSLLNHRRLCRAEDEAEIILPTPENNKLGFKNFSHDIKVPFCVYADFECIAVKNTTKRSTTHTSVLTNHVASGFSYVVVNCNGKVIRSNEYVDERGDNNVVEMFLTCMIDEENKILPILTENAKMNFTKKDQLNFNQSNTCHICEKDMGDRVAHRDHAHISGEHYEKGAYRGKAHMECNLRYRDANFLPVLFHNFRYDSLLLLPQFGKVGSDRKIQCLARSMENYISISWGSIRFIDSFAFLSSSLDNLVKSLASGDPTREKFPILSKHFGENYALFTRKGTFPYEYMDSNAKFAEKSLPPKESFFNILTQEHVSDEDYNHAHEVWEKTNCKNLGMYQSIYNLVDVLLLAEVFETFRRECLDAYKLDPCHYYTLPGLTWDACLKMTGKELELITDMEMLEFVESGIRGGVSMISHRLATANNKYIPETYDPNKPSSYIMYLDANNLYGSAMSMTLPLSDLKWEDPDDFNLQEMSLVENKGYLLEVDLEYDDHLHDLHSDFPLAPEHLIISDDILSPYSRNLRKKDKIIETQSVKLTPNLRNKTKYVVHSKLLAFYIEHGLKVTKIHRILSFTQSNWLESYISFNTEKRKLAVSKFQKDFYKLMNNAIYGKTIENQRNWVLVEMITSKKRMKKMLGDSSVVDFHVFNDNFVLVIRKRAKVKVNRPLYLGTVILELSKLIMYQFHYDFIISKYGLKAKLCFTDTDSLTYFIESPDIYQDFSDHQELFDTSDYPKTHFLYSEVNKKVLGKFKDEMNGVPIMEFCGLKAKCYSIKAPNNYSKKVAKGVSRPALKKIPHEHFVSTLQNKETHRSSMYFIRNIDHSLSTINVHKTSLTSYDDKRFVLDDGISTYAHFHKNIRLRNDDGVMDCGV